MADDRRVVYSISVNPQEGLKDENLNLHWIQDSDIKIALGGSNAIDINSIQPDSWYKSYVVLNTTGTYPGLGDERITSSNNRDFSSSGDWTSSNASSVTIVSEALKIVTNGDNNNDEGTILASEKFTAIEASKKYRVTAKLKQTAGATTPKVKFGLGGASVLVKAVDGSPSDGTIDAVEQEYYADITTINNTGDLTIFRPSSDDAATTTFTIDDVSVKEVPIVEFFYVKNNSSGADNILISFDKSESAATYLIKVPPGEAFACRMNALGADNLHIKASANDISSEYLSAKAE
mgnify:CR=1 FL=1|tara:strand:+ start:3009 stop:3884 length:876 start_codon:yes stop_codon:yes gene_type:complete